MVFCVTIVIHVRMYMYVQCIHVVKRDGGVSSVCVIVSVGGVWVVM